MTSELNPDDLAWTAQSVRVEDFRCDIVFHLSTGIQFCDAVTGHIIPGEAASLPMPDLPIIGTSGVAASTLVGREQELVGHYRSVVAAFARHGRAAQLQRRSPYFWLKPAIIANGTVLTECPWYDTVPEAEELLRALVSGPDAPDGELWDDLDQGWQMRIVKSAGSVYLAEWDWEQQRQPASGQAFDPMRLSREACAALRRLHVVHRVLVEALAVTGGADMADGEERSPTARLRKSRFRSRGRGH